MVESARELTDQLFLTPPTSNSFWAHQPAIQGYGLQIRDNNLILNVLVDEKLPRAKCQQLIPSEVRFGPELPTIKTDVTACGILSLQNGVGGSIRHPSADDYGTFGCVVNHKHNVQKRYLLSCCHVIGLCGYGSFNDEIHDLNGRTIAHLKNWMLLDPNTSTHYADAAIAELVDPDIDISIPGIGRPRGHGNMVWQGMEVRKFGARTEYKESVVRETGYTIFVRGFEHPNGHFDLTFRDQVVCDDFTDPGDSGSVVLDEFDIVKGLHFYGGNGVSVFNPIRYVLDPLDIDITTEPIVRPESGSTVPVVFGQLTQPQSFENSVVWQLTKNGVAVNHQSAIGTNGQPVTAKRVWDDFSGEIIQASKKHSVPIELIIATICTESGGRKEAIREESGFVSDVDTPSRVSAGLMQTLLSTASDVLGRTVSRADLFDPAISIDAGTGYIREQEPMTSFDPPKVACAYNAGRLKHDNSVNNRWKMRQFPIGTGDHANRFVLWFNDCFRIGDLFASVNVDKSLSFWRAFHG